MSTCKPDISRFSDRPSLARAAAEAAARGLSARLADEEIAILAIPGGSTACQVLPPLAAMPLPWDRIRITLVDERWIPPDHPDSNEALVRSLLRGPAAAATLLGLHTEAPSPQAALVVLSARIPSPSVVLLGMGDDGHIASLFPYDPANQAEDRFAAVHRPDHPRVTFTPPVLGAAQTLILAFGGTAKAAIFDRALEPGPCEALPVRHAICAGARIFVGP